MFLNIKIIIVQLNALKNLKKNVIKNEGNDNQNNENENLNS